MKTRDTGPPQWDEVLDAWKSARVPDVEVWNFKPLEHHPDLPWVQKQSGQQYADITSPERGTAYHICVVLPQQPSELKIAYYLYAFWRQYNLLSLCVDVLSPVFLRNNSSLYAWWNHNARYVLPPVDSRGISFDIDFELKEQDREHLVHRASLLWRQVAEETAVLKIPQWMDRSSEEYQLYQWHLAETREAKERAEYERLRKKFGQ